MALQALPMQQKLLQTLSPSVAITDQTLIVRDYSSTDPTCVGFFTSLADNLRSDRFDRAVRVGVVCLEQAQQSDTVAHVKFALEQAVAAASLSIQAMPAEVAKLMGVHEGQALNPLLKELETLQQEAKAASQSLSIDLLAKLDPNAPDSHLAKALRDLDKMLDPDHANSAPARIQACTLKLAEPDGPLAQSVRQALDTLLEARLKPISGRIAELQELLIAQRAAKEIEQKTTLKGRPFEERIAYELSALVKPLGGIIIDVAKANQTGDILIEFARAKHSLFDATIVVEAKAYAGPSNKLGQGKITETMHKAMTNYGAQIGLLVGEAPEAFTDKVGEFDAGHCPSGAYYTCTPDHLPFVLRFALQVLEFERRASSAATDRDVITKAVAQIKDSLKSTSQMRKHLTLIANAEVDLRILVDEHQRKVESAVRAVEAAVEVSA